MIATVIHSDLPNGFTLDEWNAGDEDCTNAEKSEEMTSQEPQKAYERGRTTAEKAIHIINGERQDLYGNPEDSFEAIASFWTAYLKNKQEFYISPKDVANMMLLFKMARMLTGSGGEDTPVDLVGYALLGAEMEHAHAEDASC